MLILCFDKKERAFIMKKLLAIVCIIALLCPLMLPITATATPASTVRISDALNILKHLAQLQPLTAEQIEKYDFFGDGRVTINSALEVLKYLARQPNRVNVLWLERAFFEYLSVGNRWNYERLKERVENNDMAMVTMYVKTYTNGVAFFARDLFVYPSDDILYLDGYPFALWSVPAVLFFYVFETSTFILFGPHTEKELLKVLSSEELRDLSPLSLTLLFNKMLGSKTCIYDAFFPKQPIFIYKGENSFIAKPIECKTINCVFCQ
jgi:hypothetical protein